MDTNTLKELNVDLSDRQYFLDAKQGKEHVSDVFIGRNTGASVVTFSSPIFNDDGKFLGVISRTCFVRY
ncbi:hypothetical protein KHA80_05250 [Anaerobacillus sp. HL2]|nr:hypothetical protein KHA80_05250 [Anaerobacillus sp. HL2]